MRRWRSLNLYRLCRHLLPDVGAKLRFGRVPSVERGDGDPALFAQFGADPGGGAERQEQPLARAGAEPGIEDRIGE